jgi:L-fucose isomerase-like protein
MMLRFGRAAVAVATMRGKSYLQIGSVTMGIGGSMISPEFIEKYLGMRVESVDEVEIIRRMSEGIYDEKLNSRKPSHGPRRTARKASTRTRHSSRRARLRRRKTGSSSSR